MFDAFYVQTADGRKLVDDKVKGELREKLLAILGNEEPETPATPAHRLRQASAADSF